MNTFLEDWIYGKETKNWHRVPYVDLIGISILLKEIIQQKECNWFWYLYSKGSELTLTSSDIY